MKFSKIVLSSIFVVLFSVFANASFAQAKEHDGEIIAYMQALNNAEINTGKLAEDKKVDDAVMDYAKMMVKHHTDNLEVVTELSEKIKVPADETPAVNKFKEKNDADLAKLSKLDNAKFQKKYIQAMIKGHTEANKMISKFEKEAQNAELKQYLEDTKVIVEEHLAAAKKLK